MRRNHELLNALGVGHPRLDDVVRIAQHSGGFASKLTGGGGGGCALTFLGTGAPRRAGVSARAAP